MIKYRKITRYKYQLLEQYCFYTRCPVKKALCFDFIVADSDGFIAIKKGYAWDGPSGPTIDTKNFMRASLVHDAMYQLIREGCIDIAYRDHADRMLQSICIEDGMSKVRAWYVYQSVKYFGKNAAVKKGGKKWN